jgi:hypothetical protein
MPTSNGPHDARTQLRNRAAALSLGAALFFFVGLLTFGTAVQATEDLALRAASGAPFALAVGGVAGARACRARLSRLGPEQDGPAAS